MYKEKLGRVIEMTSLHYNVTFSTETKKEKRLKIKNFYLFKTFLLKISKDYLKTLLSNNNYIKDYEKQNKKLKNIILSDLKKLSNLTFINPKTTNIEGYNALEHNSYINVSLKPFKNFTAKPPVSFLKLKLGGVWWLLTSDVMEARLTSYQINEIIESLKLLHQYMQKRKIKFERKDDFKKLFKFLSSKNLNYVDIKTH